MQKCIIVMCGMTRMVELGARKPPDILAPLTFQQSFFLKLQHRDNSTKRQLAFALRLYGELNTDLLQKSFEVVVSRHDSLRTRIIAADGILKQHVNGDHAFSLNLMDCTRIARGDINTHAANLVLEVCDRECDISVGPLFGARIVRLEKREHVLIWHAHHTVIDDLSASLMFRELWLLYAEFLKGQPSPFHAPPSQYSDYARWQHDTKDSWDLAHGVYWRESLADSVPIQWPVDRPVKRNTWGVAAGMEAQFGSLLSSALRVLARRARTRLAMLLLTGYAEVVFRWCGQRDFIVPLNIAGQHDSEHFEIIGYFAQALYLRVKMTGDETFIDLLRKVSHEFSCALLHQDFGRIAAQTPEPVWSACFTANTLSIDQISGVPTPAEARSIEMRAQRFSTDCVHVDKTPMRSATDMGISFDDHGEEITAGVYYRTDLFERSVIEEFMSDLRSTLERLVEDPCARIATEQRHTR